MYWMLNEIHQVISQLHAVGAIMKYSASIVFNLEKSFRFQNEKAPFCINFKSIDLIFFKLYYTVFSYHYFSLELTFNWSDINFILYNSVYDINLSLLYVIKFYILLLNCDSFRIDFFNVTLFFAITCMLLSFLLRMYKNVNVTNV